MQEMNNCDETALILICLLTDVIQFYGILLYDSLISFSLLFLNQFHGNIKCFSRNTSTISSKVDQTYLKY